MNQKIEKMVIEAKDEIADNYDHDERCEDYFDYDELDRKKWMEEHYHVSHVFYRRGKKLIGHGPYWALKR